MKKGIMIASSPLFLSLLMMSGTAAASTAGDKPADYLHNGQASYTESKQLKNELLNHLWGDTPALREEYGMLSARNAEEEASCSSCAGVRPFSYDSNRGMADTGDLEMAQKQLVSEAGDFAAASARLSIYKKLYAYWDVRKQELIIDLGKAQGKKLTGAGENKTAALLEAERQFDQSYQAAFKKNEYIIRLYNGDNDPETFRPYKEEADKANEQLRVSGQNLALAKSGVQPSSKIDGRIHELSLSYGNICVLSMKDRIYLKLMEERTGRQRKRYLKAYDYYRDSLIKYKYISDRSSETQQDRDTRQQSIIREMEKLSDAEWGRLGLLRAEEAESLDAQGYFDDEASLDQAMIPTEPVKPAIKKVRIDGEARIDYGSHHSEEAIGDRLRARLRVYGDYNIDDNWQFFTMLENTKILTGRGKDNWMDWGRYYITGNVGKSRLTAGAYGSFLAEGNIYDGKFTGLRIQGETPFHYMMEAGKVPDADSVFAAEAYYDYGDYTLGGGLYRFNMNDYDGRTIGMVNMHHLLGSWNFGAMGLYGTDGRNSHGGYVFSLWRGIQREWVKGNKYYFIKYYYQPYTTYVSHTMEGMAGYMPGGFKGIGAGYYYTLAPNWVLQMEAYRLKDPETGANNHTFWIALSYFFANYDS